MPEPEILQAMVNGAIRIVIVFIPWARQPLKRYFLTGIAVYVGASLLAAGYTASQAGFAAGFAPFGLIALNVAGTFGLSYSIFFGYHFVLRWFARRKAGSAAQNAGNSPDKDATC